MSDVSQNAVRVTKAADRDHADSIPGTQLGNLEALEKNIQRLLADIREQKHELLAHKPVARRKTREAVPSIVNLIFVCFPSE